MDTTAKLAKCEASMRRWQTRLNRAVNALNKLDRQRRRLLAGPKVRLVKKIENYKPTDAAQPMPVVEQTDIPTFLRRGMEAQKAVDTIIDPVKMKQEREAKIDKKRMPLSGKAALEAVRPKRKAAPKHAAT